MGLPAAGDSRQAERTNGSEHSPHQTPVRVQGLSTCERSSKTFWTDAHTFALLLWPWQQWGTFKYLQRNEKESENMRRTSGAKCLTKKENWTISHNRTHRPYMVEGGGVRTGRGHFHLERRDKRVMGGAASTLRLPPVLTQAASQQEVLPWSFIFTCKTQQGVLCREPTEANSALDTLWGIELKKSLTCIIDSLHIPTRYVWVITCCTIQVS